MSNNSGRPTSRREFLTTTAATGAAVAAGLSLASNVHAAGTDEIRVGIIGCGGRGTDAGTNVLQAAPGVKIVALGDAFADRLRDCHGKLQKFGANDEQVKKLGNKVDVGDHLYEGLDAYERVLSTPGLNYVILATPPGFRPPHLQAAVAAGVNIFTEKPVGVDAPGIRKVLAAAEIGRASCRERV